jgi:hypothetical protein
MPPCKARTPHSRGFRWLKLIRRAPVQWIPEVLPTLVHALGLWLPQAPLSVEACPYGRLWRPTTLEAHNMCPYGLAHRASLNGSALHKALHKRRLGLRIVETNQRRKLAASVSSRPHQNSRKGCRALGGWHQGAAHPAAGSPGVDCSRSAGGADVQIDSPADDTAGGMAAASTPCFETWRRAQCWPNVAPINVVRRCPRAGRRDRGPGFIVAQASASRR